MLDNILSYSTNLISFEGRRMYGRHTERLHIEFHILLDWQRSTRALFMFCSLFSTFSSSLSSPAEAISSLLLLPVIPVTAEGSSFLTAPDALAEEMRFFKPSTLLLKCLAWSSKLAVWS